MEGHEIIVQYFLQHVSQPSLKRNFIRFAHTIFASMLDCEATVLYSVALSYAVCNYKLVTCG